MWIYYAIYIVVMIALAVAAYLLTPKPKADNTAKKPDTQTPTTEEGTKIPILFGTRTINEPIITWYGEVDIKEIKKPIAGKK